MTYRFLGRLSLLIFFLIMLIYSAVVWCIWHYDTKPINPRADAAVVLGASTTPSGPSLVYRARIDHAIDLYRQGAVNSIILTGGMIKGQASSDAKIAQRYASSAGVPIDDLLIEEQSKTTKQNLIYMLELADEYDIHSFVIVSDPLHLMRAMAMADDLGVKAIASGTPTSRYVSWSVKMEFALREAYYYLAYQIFGSVLSSSSNISNA